MGASNSERIARGSGKKTSTPSRPDTRLGYGDYRFVRVELSTEQKDEFRALVDAGEFDRFSIDDFLKSGYTVKFSAQDAGKTITCSVTCGVAGDVNCGLILTGRGRDSTTAARVVAFKDVYCCDDGAWASGERRGGEASDDIG